MVIPGRCPHCGVTKSYTDEDKVVRCSSCDKPPGWAPPPRTKVEISREKQRREALHTEDHADRAAAEVELENRITRENLKSPSPEPVAQEVAQEVTKVNEATFHLPADWDKYPKFDRGIFYEEHKEAILEAVKGLTLPEAFEKTGIPASTLCLLKKKWRGGLSEPIVRPKNKRFPYFEEHKEAIVADYLVMTLKNFYAKWKMASGTWTELKTLWGITGKHKPHKHKRATVVTPEPEVNPEVTPEPESDLNVRTEPESEPLRNGPMNKRIGARAIWRF